MATAEIETEAHETTEPTRINPADKLRERIKTLQQDISALCVLMADLKDELADRKKYQETLVDSLRKAQRELDSGDIQPELFDAPSDDFAETLLSEIGITSSVLERLEAEDVKTVGQLEAFMADGKFVPGRVKRIGQTAIDAVTDALVKFREEHPIPTEDDDVNFEAPEND